MAHGGSTTSCQIVTGIDNTGTPTLGDTGFVYPGSLGGYWFTGDIIPVVRDRLAPPEDQRFVAITNGRPLVRAQLQQQLNPNGSAFAAVTNSRRQIQVFDDGFVGRALNSSSLIWVMAARRGNTSYWEWILFMARC
jgi:hypothetical protein